MVTRYKQKCYRCKKNYVITSYRNSFPVCYDCCKEELSKPVNDPAMKKFFAIPEDYYKQNSFLVNIKLNYLKYGTLTEKQIAAFKKVVEDIEHPKAVP
ncbi:hypothetical protein HZB02_01460 [Candidatus Woesearchaeota archaeon]|nr:hypothetical protein [Candidatus Woesearchaeota archaeon]